MDLPSCSDEKMLRDMYCGEDTRDATSKILGYLYQDLVAIEYLLDENVEFLCMECIEDIFFVRNSVNGREYHVVQVKYYPKSNIKRDDVLRDLYYQYIRMERLGYKNTKPHLKYHRYKRVEFTKNNYDELDNLIAKSSDEGTGEDIIDYIKEEVNRNDSIKKTELENIVIKRFSDKVSFEKFQNEMKNGNDFSSLNESDYSNELSKKIVDFLKIKKEEYDSEQQQEILLGLAISRIHWFYQHYANEKDPTKKIIKPKDFWDYVRNGFDIPIKIISGYIFKILREVEGNISSNLCDCGDSNEIVDMRHQYETIFFNTEKWLNEITNSENGIRSLIKTVSQEKEPIENTLFLQVVSEKIHIEDFLTYLVRIIFDIYNAQKADGNDDVTLPDPAKHCFDYNSCIIFRFEKDCGTSMILSDIRSRPKSILRNVYPRLREYKPQKWYMPGSCNFRGQKSYSSNVCDIVDQTDEERKKFDVSYIHEGNFVVECMSCIKIDEDDWHNVDLSTSSKFLKPDCEEENG